MRNPAIMEGRDLQHERAAVQKKHGLFRTAALRADAVAGTARHGKGLHGILGVQQTRRTAGQERVAPRGVAQQSLIAAVGDASGAVHAHQRLHGPIAQTFIRQSAHTPFRV